MAVGQDRQGAPKTVPKASSPLAAARIARLTPPGAGGPKVKQYKTDGPMTPGGI